MVDFNKSFDIGISAAERAEVNRNEISSVFDDLNSQLDSGTNGKIKISIYEYSEKAHPLKITLFEKPKKYLALAASNPHANSEVKKLARWSEDRAGYPCKISFASKEIYCDDKGALEEGLSTLLCDPVVGDVLRKLVNRPSGALKSNDGVEDSNN